METGKWIGYGDVTINTDLPDRGKHYSLDSNPFLHLWGGLDR
jgi:hypothetical protein